MRIILSRTDSIGDVVLTLPMAGILKEKFPECFIVFLGKKYTRPVIERCRFVDQFLDWEEITKLGGPGTRDKKYVKVLSDLKADVIIHVFPVKPICRAAKEAGIPLRIATSRRSFTWFTCNRLVHYSRKKSALHEAQLNLKLLRPLGFAGIFDLVDIPAYYGLSRESGREGLANLVSADRFNLILHPRSKGSAREWGLENFGKLIELLPASKFNIMVAGTEEEGASMVDFLKKYQLRITNLTGKLSLNQYIDLIVNSDGLVAASTGPLHLAAAFGIMAIGLYAPMRPIFPKRWAPLGPNATYLVLDKKCEMCRKSGDCSCIRNILPEQVAAILINGLE